MYYVPRYAREDLVSPASAEGARMERLEVWNSLTGSEVDTFIDACKRRDDPAHLIWEETLTPRYIRNLRSEQDIVHRNRNAHR